MGLLDEALFAPQVGVGASLLGAPSVGVGLSRGLLLGQQLANGKEDREIQRAYREAQAESLRGEAELRKAKILEMQRNQARDEFFLGSFGGVSGAPQSAGVASIQGQIGSMPAQVGPTPGGLLGQIAQKYKLPYEALAIDYLKNGGKKIPEMIESRTKPNWQVLNNNLVDTNATGFQGGIQDGVFAGPDGRVTIVRGNNGNPITGALPGSLGTYSAFEMAKGRASAMNTPGRPSLDENGRLQGQSQFQEMGGGSPRPAPALMPGQNFQGAGYNGGSRAAANGERLAILQSELQQPGLPEADRAAIQREIAWTQQETPSAVRSPAGALDFSPGEKATQNANSIFQQDVAKAAAGSIETSKAGADSANQTLANIYQIRGGLGNAILGPGANTRVQLAQIGQVLGVGGANSQEVLNNTRNVIQGLARQELSASASMKGQGQITENERAILRRAESGNISEFTSGELQTMLGALEKTANYRISQHSTNMDRLSSGASPAAFLQSSPAPAQAVAPKAALRWNPSTQRLEKVQ